MKINAWAVQSLRLLRDKARVRVGLDDISATRSSPRMTKDTLEVPNAEGAGRDGRAAEPMNRIGRAESGRSERPHPERQPHQRRVDPERKATERRLISSARPWRRW